MPNIVTITDFTCEAAIPGLFPDAGTVSITNAVVQKKVNDFIAKYEPKFIDMFFIEYPEQKELLNANNALTDESEKDEALTALATKLKPAIVNFIAYYYMRNEASSNTGIGAVIKQGENGKRTNNMPRLCKFWNEMRDIVLDVYYSQFQDSALPNEDIFFPINEYNL